MPTCFVCIFFSFYFYEQLLKWLFLFIWGLHRPATVVIGPYIRLWCHTMSTEPVIIGVCILLFVVVSYRLIHNTQEGAGINFVIGLMLNISCWTLFNFDLNLLSLKTLSMSLSKDVPFESLKHLLNVGHIVKVEKVLIVPPTEKLLRYKKKCLWRLLAV